MNCARSCFAVLALLSFASGAASAQDPHPTFSVGTATAARGQRAYGVLHVPAGSDPATDIAVAVVHGARPGPSLAIVSGAHGTEYASVIAVEKLIDAVNPSDLSGTLVLVPLVNVQSFEKMVPHVNPVDQRSMNGSYPGRLDGTQTERASYVITKEVVDKCDHLIDLHGGDLDESLRPYSYWTVTGNQAQDDLSKQMVLAFGLDHVIIAADRPKDPNASRFLDTTASTRGKASFAAEAGYAGTVDTDDVAALVNGSLNVMRLLKMLPGEAPLVEHPVWLEKVVTLSSDVTGIFYPLVRRGTYVEQGMKIGYVTDYVNRVIFEAHAPATGVITFIRAVPSLVKGQTIANVGVVQP
ncbi:MAG: M14 family metallopeptidase [Betaproteobacteria bacterium]